MEVRGFADARFGPVRECFVEVLRAQPGTGAGFAAWCDGRPVVDLWGGYADVGRHRPWDADSLVQPYSVSKPFVAVCALRLVEAKRLDLDAPVQRYWPEFRAPAAVRQVLSHQAGVVMLDRPAPTEAFYDWDRLCGLLAAQEPSWEPGTAHGESALFYGHLVGELVRRVDGRRVGRFLREEVCGPAGLDFAVGLNSPQQAQAVDLTGLDDAFRAASASGRPELYRLAVTNPPGALDAAVVNGAAWRAAEIPAVNGHGTARAVAGFYAALQAGSLLSPAMLAEAVTAQCAGADRVFGEDNAWGLGFGIGGDGYGMGGLGGSYGGASTAGGYSIGFVTGSAGSFDRVDALENTLRNCLGLAPIPAAGDSPAGS
ncbi:MAG: beta-lactamase family protein [Streptosporangiaceae bacterium]|nr:beta-lactamase family protein [Streptosporangiaceae bacterium]